MYSKVKQVARKVLTVESNIESGLYRYLSDRETTEKIREQLRNMPISNGSAYYKKINKTVGIIADEFIYMVYKDCCDLVYLTPENWQDVISNLDAVIIVSTWRGLNKEWEAIHIKDSYTNQQVEKIKTEARNKDIPVVFYSKEDPPNFEVFLSLAKDVDVIFTSAEECIEKYNMEYPATPCFCLNFTFNPILHNPIGLCENMFENTVVFAGSWMKKYPIRTEEQKQIFEYIYKSGLNLTIIDRNFERKERNYLYPWKYVKDVVASFTYTEIAKIYKMFPFVLNLNSVSKSSTMFANRVYDASACGSLLLSNNSKGMERLFPEVRVVKEQSDIESIKDISEKDMYSKRVKVIRDTYKKNTAYENMSYVLECAGIKVDTIVNPLVGVVISDGYTGEREYQDMFQRQTYQNKVLLSEEEWHNSLIPIDYVSFWSKEMKYEENYVEDIINGFKFTDSDYVARASENQSRHNYVGYVKDKYKTIYKLKNGKDISEQKGYLIH